MRNLTPDEIKIVHAMWQRKVVKCVVAVVLLFMLVSCAGQNIAPEKQVLAGYQAYVSALTKAHSEIVRLHAAGQLIGDDYTKAVRAYNKGVDAAELARVTLDAVYDAELAGLATQAQTEQEKYNAVMKSLVTFVRELTIILDAYGIKLEVNL